MATITGTNGADILNDTSGNDIITGLGGDDVINMRGGRDEIDGGDGDDTINVFGHNGFSILGGNGYDTVDLSFLGVGIVVVNIVDTERVIGTAFDDSLTAEDATGEVIAHELRGGDGDDALTGANGDDLLLGGNDTDTLAGRRGADTLDGGAGNDTLSGEDGDDRLIGGGGDDLLDGGFGAGDWAWYADASASVTASLATGIATGSATGADTLIDLENLRGGRVGDRLFGSAAANIIDGGEGNDRIDAAAGNDTVLGGAGNDTIDGGADNDLMYGDAPFSPNQTRTAGGVTAGGSTIAISLTGATADPDSTTSVFGYVGTTTPGAANLNIVYVVDVSGSMADPFQGSETVGDLNGDGASNTLLDGAIASYAALNASLVAAGLGSTAQVSLVIFDDTSSTVYAGKAADDADGNGTADVVDALRTLRVGGATYFDLGLAEASDALRASPPGSNYVFFLSDGEPNGGPYADEVQTLLDDDLATIRAIGLGTGASLTALDLVDDGIANASAERVLTPSALTAGLIAPTIDLAEIDRVDVLLNGVVVKTVRAADLLATPFGLQFDAALTGLSTTANDIVTAVVTTTGAAPIAVPVSITIAQQLSNVGGADILRGSDGTDTLDGNGGNDQMFGDAGNDSLVGNLGDDLMDGGQNFDTADYSGQFQRVVVDLGLGSASGATIGVDTLVSIERAVGGADDDLLIAGNPRGTSAPDFIKAVGVDNSTIASSFSLDGQFDLDASAEIVDATTIPHATVIAAGGGHVDYYAFTANAGAIATLDIDGATFGSVIGLYDAAGNFVAANDNSDGGGAPFDANLRIGLIAGGTYHILIRNTAASGVIALGERYALHLSLTGAPLSTSGPGSELVGNGGNDLIVGARGDDVLDGGLGRDTVSYESAGRAIVANLATGLATGDGRDTLARFEAIAGSAFDDRLTGDALANALRGFDGADVLMGGEGADVLDGGAGVDLASYATATAGVTVSLALTGAQDTGPTGRDTLIRIEDLAGSDFADLLIGNDTANHLNGGDGDDVLNGGRGNDRIDGGAGIDEASYAGAASAVSVSLVTGAAQNTGGAGSDVLIAIENLVGSGFNDNLTGNAAANRLDGGAGVDRMDGGGGDDNYIVDMTQDIVIERVAGGYDAVTASANYTLAANVEKLSLVGLARVGTGNGLDNMIVGSSDTNTLAGLDGADTLLGGAGDDLLDGGTGNDWVEGGVGRDQLTGGSGADRFVFRAGATAATTTSADRIVDFRHAEADRIVLSPIDANSGIAGDQAFSFIGTAAFSNVAGQLRYQRSGPDLFVQGDMNGDGVADLIVRLSGVATLVAADFIL